MGSSFNEDEELEIHGFSDASELAYSAVVFVQIITTDTTTSHISSKTKVAPLEDISIPRLELQDAELLANLFQYVINESKFEPIRIVLWTDSKQFWSGCEVNQEYGRYNNKHIQHVLQNLVKKEFSKLFIKFYFMVVSCENFLKKLHALNTMKLKYDRKLRRGEFDPEYTNVKELTPSVQNLYKYKHIQYEMLKSTKFCELT